VAAQGERSLLSPFFPAPSPTPSLPLLPLSVGPLPNILPVVGHGDRKFRELTFEGGGRVPGPNPVCPCHDSSEMFVVEPTASRPRWPLASGCDLLRYYGRAYRFPDLDRRLARCPRSFVGVRSRMDHLCKCRFAVCGLISTSDRSARVGEPADPPRAAAVCRGRRWQEHENVRTGSSGSSSWPRLKVRVECNESVHACRHSPHFQPLPSGAHRPSPAPRLLSYSRVLTHCGLDGFGTRAGVGKRSHRVEWRGNKQCENGADYSGANIHTHRHRHAHVHRHTDASCPRLMAEAATTRYTTLSSCLTYFPLSSPRYTSLQICKTCDIM
jgi:hypothetical protein